MLWNAHETGFRLVAGQTVGLLGGSFDPPHAGHVHITLEALRRFRLDRVIWLVSPGNPLKPRGPAPLPERMAAARGIMRHPRVIVSDFERLAGTRHTARTLKSLRQGFPGVRFVWLMGADNLAQLHRWDDWHQIMGQMPVGVLARPGSRMAARGSVAADVYRHARLPARAAPLLARSAPPAWCFVNVPMVDLSSTELRRVRAGRG
ncbi:nicotinate-nucleotide adenylyltransferase [Salipiger abyssi]|uniref:nicotinate-nucleotide adenylyltransferase n=1 Tax=Salipiger abyssi TaxID=1250539 RepID=UPI00405820AF